MTSVPVMDMPTPLVDRLRECADLWTAAHAARPGRLGRLVINDGGFFTRIESPGASVTTATLERFARFLADPANWPEGEDGRGAVPEAVHAFAHVVGVCPDSPAASPDSGARDIGAREAVR